MQDFRRIGRISAFTTIIKQVRIFMDIETLIARASIEDLVANYCRGLDRIDEPTLRAIYHEDAIEDRGEDLFIGLAHEWIGWTLKVLPVFAVTQHGIMNSLIEVDGEVAHGETYFQAYHRFGAAAREAAALVASNEDISWPEGETEMILGGRYLDRFERRNGVWKIAYRKMVCDWCRTQPVAEGWFEENPTAYRAVRHIDDARLGTRLHPLNKD